MLIIRDYKEQDAKESWLLFFNTVRKINSNDYTEAQVSAWATESMDMFIWNKRMSDIEPFIAEIDGKIVGYADLQNDGLIELFFVHADYQKQGIAKALMAHILKDAKQRKIKLLFAQVSITAKPFFESIGFNVTEELLVEVKEEALVCYSMKKVG